MKKILFLLMLCLCLFTIGCGKKNQEVVEKLEKNINNLTAYNIKGDLEIINNEDIYTYKVDSSYKESNLFRVSLKNVNNNHTQILLKNSEGVYVITPSLNKSFKFQSDWPYNNSQIYLLQTILKDITDDNDKVIEEKNGEYIITSKVNYSNNDELVKQDVYVDKNGKINKIEVKDDNNNVLMRMVINSINENPNFSEDYFDVNSSLNVFSEEDSIAVSKLTSVIYPMYIPTKTYLSSQDKVITDSGERIILTFDGDNPFMLVQETASIKDEMVTIPVYGKPELVGDTIGMVSDNSVSWSTNGIDYYVTSNNLSEKEMLAVANSINVLPVGK